MDTSLKLQLDVKNNAQELQNYLLDLSNWEEEMKKKEIALSNEKPRESVIPPPRNKSKRSKPENEKKYSDKPKKISAYDYSGWSKFDVEKALAEIDKEDEYNEKNEQAELKENIGDEAENNKDNDTARKNNEKFSLIDEAFYEKEMGNQFVKKEQWNEAIKCYTNAINLDSSNAIFYANRSLCFLKLKNFKSSETDATTAIQLDKKYVKAFQRRAFARQALGQLAEAKSDYEEVLKLEPKNALARVEINKIDEKLKKEQGVNKKFEKKTGLSFNLKNVFKNENNKPQLRQTVDFSELQHCSSQKTESSKKTVVLLEPESKTTTNAASECRIIADKNDNVKVKENKLEGCKSRESDKIVLNQFSKTKLEVFKPLPEWCKIIQPVNVPPHKRSKKLPKRIDIAITDKDEDIISVIETKNESLNAVKGKKKRKKNCKKKDEALKNERLSFDVPKTAIQFYNCWKILKKDPENSYSYLKSIPATKLPEIFENSLESDFFSEIVMFLASDEIQKDPEIIYNFLWGLSKVKRFNFLVLFMSEADKKCVRKAVSQIVKVKTFEEISELLRLYELKV